MKLPQNIHKSWHKGEYVGYCKGAQRIKRGGLGWQTVALVSTHGEPVFTSARTLMELGAKLERIGGSAKKFCYRIVDSYL